MPNPRPKKDQDRNPNSGTLVWLGCCHFDQTSADISSARAFGILPELEKGTNTPGGGACTSAILSQLQFEYQRNQKLKIGKKAAIGNMNEGETSGWFQARVQRKLAGRYSQVPEIHTHRLADSFKDPDSQSVPLLDSSVLDLPPSKKFAVIIGINYPGSSFPLKGCIADAVGYASPVAILAQGLNVENRLTASAMQPDLYFPVVRLHRGRGPHGKGHMGETCENPTHPNPIRTGHDAGHSYSTRRTHIQWDKQKYKV